MFKSKKTRPVSGASKRGNLPFSRRQLGGKMKSDHPFRHYLSLHRHVAAESIDQLWHRPMGSLMTVIVIGLSLAFPLVLQVFIHNGDNLLGVWREQSQLSLFLTDEVSESGGLQLSTLLATMPDVASTQYLSKTQSLQEYERSSKTSVPLEFLGENPLPAVIVVNAVFQKAGELERLRVEFDGLPEVEFVQLDLQWVQRLRAMLAAGERFVQALSLMLASAVLFVVMNTLRLVIEHRKKEIEITLLVGGTYTYIRRPFLYLGLWYGLGGGLLAVSAVETILWWMESSVTRLSGLYQSQFELQSIAMSLFLGVLLLSSLLGVVGAWVEVSLHLRRITPK